VAPIAKELTRDPKAKPAAGRKILIVDDSPTERYFLADLLSKRGYVVVTAENGEEALAKVRSEKPSLVVMDVVMPGTSGFQATRAIARDPATSGIPVILCTSKGAESDKIWGLRQGAREYVIKPVDPEELLAKIASLA
jgi:twitching motility two-component system response regulator PilH